MRFNFGAPGLLHDFGSGDFRAYWNVAADNYGYSQVAVTATVEAALTDPLGWGQVGITFEHVADSDRDAATVTFQVVETITADNVGAGVQGLTIPGGYDYPGWAIQPNTWIQIEAAHFADLGIPNHEAAHAYFGATHSAEGADSLMEPYEDPGTEWPSATDLAQVEAWLATAPEEDEHHDNPRGEVTGEALWFPGDLPSYVTKWPVPEGSESRVSATVMGRARAALQPVYHADYSELMAGNGKRFSVGVDCYQEGLIRSAWRSCPTGEVYVGIEVHKDEGADIHKLIVGLAEVQIRST